MVSEIKVGKLDGDKVAEVRVEPKAGGEPWAEKWRGISRRHALGEARAHYRDKALVYFANGEPY